MSSPSEATRSPQRHGRSRELYIDAFRGLMALVMVQGHVFDFLLSADLRAEPLYQFQVIFHGSTAPGFLFASGFVAGLPRAPLSLSASLRRARRLLFVLLVGYALHLPYFSLWKTLQATPAERAALLACDALQAIAVTQLAVLLLQWPFGRHWPAAAGGLAALVLATGPFVWGARLSQSVPAWLGAYLDDRSGSHFPLFPFAAFVLAGTVAGATLGRVEPRLRRRRAMAWGVGLIAAGFLLSLPLEGRVDFWGVSPAYALVRLGGLLLLLRIVLGLSERDLPGLSGLALLGRETLQVFVLHLHFLFGGVLGPEAPLTPLAGRLGFGQAALALGAMLPVLLAAAWLWHRAKARWPHASQQALVFAGVLFTWEFCTRPW